MSRVCLALALSALGCSAISNTYLRPGYEPAAPGAVKRVAVIGWAPAGQDALALLTARIAADRLHLRTNYIVAPAAGARVWNAGCEAGSFASTPTYDSHHSHPPERLRDGVVLVELLGFADSGTHVALTLSAELRRCADGALLWRAQGARATDPRHADLRQLVAAYVHTGGEAAERFAAPAFALLQELLERIPDPVLSEEELLEKIDTD